MGLDMFLYCNSRTLVHKVHEGEPYGKDLTDFYRQHGIAMYWRKTNAVHKWFVDNVQDGRDNCGLYEVEWEQLMELHDLCKRVLEHHDDEYALKSLPPQSGFFFGSREIDDWYWKDLSRTVEEIERIDGMLEDRDEGFYTAKVVPEEPDWLVTFYYRSSW